MKYGKVHSQTGAEVHLPLSQPQNRWQTGQSGPQVPRILGVHAQDCTGANRHDLHLPPSRQPEVRALRNQCRWLCSERWRSAACLVAPVIMNIPRDVSALQRNALQHTATH